jgi:hypothetical protein
VLAAIASIAALVFGLLWISASGSRDDAVDERDLALTERDAAIATGIELNNELETTHDQLAAAEAAAAAGETGADETEIGDLQAEIDRLTAEVERLTAENESLQADLAAGESPPTTVPPATSIAPETTVAPETTTAPVPAEATPPSVSEVGEWLSSLYRRSVLGQGQKDCLGQTVLDELGAVRVVTLLNSDDAKDAEDLIDALRDAAATCGVDPSAIFG